MRVKCAQRIYRRRDIGTLIITIYNLKVLNKMIYLFFFTLTTTLIKRQFDMKMLRVFRGLLRILLCVSDTRDFRDKASVLIL